jgi:hypothetical protein
MGDGTLRYRASGIELFIEHERCRHFDGAPSKMDAPTFSPQKLRNRWVNRSKQDGVSVRGKYWYGYDRETMLDPETNPQSQ